MYAHDLSLRDGEHAEGVVLPQVRLARERKLRQVRQVFKVAGVHPRLIERVSVVRVERILREPLSFVTISPRNARCRVPSVRESQRPIRGASRQTEQIECGIYGDMGIGTGLPATPSVASAEPSNFRFILGDPARRA